MLLAVIKALVKYKNILNTATSLEYFLLSITFTFAVANGPLTSINQTCSVDISSSVSFTRECGYGIKVMCRRNITFVRHKFLVLAVKMVKIGVYLRKLSQN